MPDQEPVFEVGDWVIDIWYSKTGLLSEVIKILTSHPLAIETGPAYQIQPIEKHQKEMKPYHTQRSGLIIANILKPKECWKGLIDETTKTEI